MRRNVTVFLILATTLTAAAFWFVTGQFSAPANHSIGTAPDNLQATNVSFNGVNGWLVPSGKKGPCVLLMHGVRSDRRSMIERAYFLKSLGYTSLLFDFQAHGESAGDDITFGAREAQNAHDAVTFLQKTGSCTGIAAVGQSMGGAAALLGPSPLPVKALVIESVYPTIEEAVGDRMQRYLGTPGRWLAPLLYEQIPLRLHIPLRSLHPIDAVASVSCPIFVIAGAADTSTSSAESRRLFAAAPTPKQFWLIPGAGHVDLYKYAGKEYESRVGDFLELYLPSR